MSSTMEVNGLYARINTPPALTGDALNALPPHCLRPVYAVDEYPACPANWMHGSAKASSYFVPVSVGRGLWFDFTMNAGHRHDIAIVVSVQGINPITGKRVTELNLEQYRENCPVHKTQFQQDRFCAECGYKWPGQNYIATTTGQTLWIDGFRNEKGEVRQYILTEEVARGIAAQVIGSDRVWAIGFAFYLSKEPRLQYVKTASFGFGGSTVMDFGMCDYDSHTECLKADIDACDNDYLSMLEGVSGPTGPTGPCGSMGISGPGPKATMSYNACSASTSKGGTSKLMRSVRMASAVQPVVQKKTLEIGAGARINQEIGVDANPIDYWQSEPVGLIYCNYVSEEVAHQIILAGKRQDKKDGTLHTLKVGN